MTTETRTACVHRLFEAQVRRTPQAPAVVCEGRRLTYEELNARANQVARHLRSLGVGPEVLAGVCVPRTPDLIVALLAVLKAGGAYVPLDPALPRERLAMMLEDSGCPVLLTAAPLLAALPEHQAQVLRLDADRHAFAQEPSEDLPGEAGPDNLAYVIYTSGSTGKPKGVQVTHGGVVNFLNSMRREPGLGDRDVVPALTTVSFDIAGLEIFLPLVVGARLALLSREIAADGPRLAARLAADGATVVQATPATWRLLLHAGWQGDKGLKILCGGEALPRQLADQLLPRCGSLWNVYGPTETTIWSTLQRVGPGPEPVSIGRPIAETQLYLLDAALRPVPGGEAGELCIGGAGVARGYRGRPDLTADRFIPDPFSGVAGARLYRTGDLARFRPDGTPEYLGRIDHQVKIRGFRVELGEIEAVLGRHPAVRDVVAWAREDEPGEKRLVAYVVPRPGQAPSPAELRALSRKSLPEYMVPAAFVFLDRLPLTASGKVDRRSLPAPASHPAGRETPYVAPRDRVERGLARLAEKVLGVRPVGVRDNLLELGADSLTAARLAAEVERTFARRLPPGPLFQAPTVEQLARLLRQEGPPPAQTSLVAIQPRGSRPALFGVHGGKGTLMVFHALARQLGPEQPVYGLQMQGLYGEAPPHSRVEEMAAHYLQEIRAVQPEGPYLLAGYCFGGIVAFEMAQQLRRLGQPVALLALVSAPSPVYIRRRGGSPAPEDAAPPPSRRTAPRLPVKPRPAGFLRRLTATLGWRAQAVRRRLDVPVRRAGCQICQALGLPLTEALRDFYFLERTGRAERVYLPQPYPGRLVLIQDPGLYEEPALGWEGLAAEIECRDLPRGLPWDPSKHLMGEPNVRWVAEQVQACLATAGSGRTTAEAEGVALAGP